MKRVKLRLVADTNGDRRVDVCDFVNGERVEQPRSKRAG
jgi:hypothetical protein